MSLPIAGSQDCSFPSKKQARLYIHAMSSSHNEEWMMYFFTMGQIQAKKQSKRGLSKETLMLVFLPSVYNNLQKISEYLAAMGNQHTREAEGSQSCQLQCPQLKDQLREDNLPQLDEQPKNPLVKVFHKQILKKTPQNGKNRKLGSRRDLECPHNPQKCIKIEIQGCANQRLFEKGKLRKVENKVIETETTLPCESSLHCEERKAQRLPSFSPLTISPQKILRMKRARVAQKYEFLQVVGQGSFGIVYRARCKSTRQLRAVKVVSLEDCSSLQRQLFLNEVATLSRLDHPNIIKMYEAIREDSTYYIVTEYCEGGSLWDYLQKTTQNPERLAKQVMHRVLSALRYLHGQRVLHRDLKLQNIVCIPVERDGWEDLEIKLIDFGLAATFREGQAVKSSVIMGTPQYMAPENITGIYTTKSDIWCCGIILHALLRGSPPFKAESRSQVYTKIRKETINLKCHQWKLYSKNARDLLGLLLKKNPDHRPDASKVLAHPWLEGYLQEQRSNLQSICVESAEMANKLLNFKRSDNFLTLLDSITLLTKFGQADRERFIPYFRLIDRNHDGEIDLSELKAFLTQNNLQIDPSYVEEILEKMDLDKSSTITLSEFLHAVCDLSKYTQQHHLDQLFCALDRNSDGTLDRRQLKSSLNNCPDLELDFLMQSMSKPLSRRVSLDEFKHYVRSARRRKSTPIQ